MLLQALYDYATSRRLLETLPFEDRTVHAIIPLDVEGNLRFQHLIPQTTEDAKGKDRPGRRLSLPSYPGEPNGGKAYFLAESAIAVFGRNKITGEPIWSDPDNAPKSEKNDSKLFQDFWRQVESGYRITNDPRLGAMLKFRDRYLLERESKINSEFSFLVTRTKEKARTADKTEFVAKIGPDDKQFIPTKDAVFAFSVAENLVTFGDEQDPMREYWKKQFSQDFSATNANESDQQADGENEDDGEAQTSQEAGNAICLVTGSIGQPIARSHNPKIRGVPFLTSTGVGRSNARIVSFAKDKPAFSSYGFTMGANATVSQDAASSYALALNNILRDENARFDVGTLAFCIWAKESPQVGSQFKRLLEKGFPEHVQDVFASLYAGIEREKVRKSERIHTAAITCATKARVAIKYWLDLPLAEAESQFEKWWNDLHIVALAPIGSANESSAANKTAELRASPYGLRQLVVATVRQSKQHKDDKLVTERTVQLYRAALEGTAPSLLLLKPILDEFHTALVKDDTKKPTFPFSQSRFALIKLILIRFFRSQTNRKEDDFMPTPQLADTPEPAYNLGRLLAVFESLQDRYHNFDKKGAGVVERFYGTASSAPAAVFPQLCRLARHHLSKVRKEDESAANRLDQMIGEILKKFQPDRPGEAPHFKRILTLPEQGVFALGFYQQRAYDRACSLVRSNLSKARELRKKNEPDDEVLKKARDFANEFGYDDLIAAVSQFESQT